MKHIYYFSIGETTDIVSKVVHVYWDGEKDQTAIDNGTLSTIVPIDEEKEAVAEAKLQAKIKANDSDDPNKSRQKRDLTSGNNGVPVVQKKVPNCII